MITRFMCPLVYKEAVWVETVPAFGEPSVDRVVGSGHANGSEPIRTIGRYNSQGFYPTIHYFRCPCGGEYRNEARGWGFVHEGQPFIEEVVSREVTTCEVPGCGEPVMKARNAEAQVCVEHERAYYFLKAGVEEQKRDSLNHIRESGNSLESLVAHGWIHDLLLGKEHMLRAIRICGKNRIESVTALRMELRCSLPMAKRLYKMVNSDYLATV